MKLGYCSSYKIFTNIMIRLEVGKEETICVYVIVNAFYMCVYE